MVRYLIGIVLLGVAFTPLCIGVRRLRRALLSTWEGSPAWLAEVLLVVASVVGVTQILGAFAVYQLGVAVVVYAGIGLGFIAVARRLATAAPPPFVPAGPARLGRTGNLFAAASLGIVAGSWTARASVGFTAGIPGADTLWYHLPAAGRLVQTGSLQEIPHFDGGNLTAYYPNASTFFHATGMLFLESDILSPLLNHGWAALALLAGWALGRPLGVAPATFLATAVTVTFPGFVGHQAGSAMNDVTALALVLAALALLVNSRWVHVTTHLPVIALAGAATGIALATKWTVVPATAALTLGVIVLSDRGHRFRTAATWLVASGFTGLFTYGRNLLLVGNPLPPMQIDLGPISLDRVGPEDPTFATIAQWLGDDVAQQTIFRPGLETWFGPLWWAAPTVAGVGLLVGLVLGGGRLNRLTAFVGLVALASYLFSPQNLVFLGAPAYFLSNLRYGILALGLGLVVLPLVPALQAGRRVWLAPLTFTVLLASSFASRGLWTGIDDWRFQDPVAGVDALAGVIVAITVSTVAIAYVLLREDMPTSVWPRISVATAALVLVVAVVAKPTYDDRRFAEPPSWNPTVDLTDARIALDGINTQFMMYGTDLSNHVQWVGRIDGHVFRPIETCAQWVASINDGRYTHAILGPSADTGTGPYRWMRDDPAAVLVADYEGEVPNIFGGGDGALPTAFFRIDDPLDASRCAT